MSLRSWCTLLPHRCVLCLQTCEQQQDLCFSCQQACETYPYDRACYRCAAILGSSESGLCGRCLQKPPAYDACLPLLTYQQEAAFLIQRFKFSAQLSYGKVLSQWYADYWQQQRQQAWPEVILPIPLHWRRRWQRGFNQSAMLAKGCAKQLGLPVDVQTLKRYRYQTPQSQLPAKQRQRNIHRAFNVGTHSYQHIALMDDVVTTGATANEAAKALKRSGVKKVEVWCLAKTIQSMR